MYHFAVCDDEQNELNKTNAMLEQYRKARPDCDFRAESVSSVHALYDKLRSGALFDLLLMDIYMPGKTGIEAAKELRRYGYEYPIIFLTTSKEHAVDAFNVDAVQYLLKPIEQARFFAVLDKVLGRVNKNRREYLALRADGEVCRIPIRDIVYCESHSNCQHINLTGNKIVCSRLTMAELAAQLAPFPAFVRCGAAYIVNLAFIDSLNAKVMKLSTGKEIWLPRGSYSNLKEQYFAFYRGGKGEFI